MFPASELCKVVKEKSFCKALTFRGVVSSLPKLFGKNKPRLERIEVNNSNNFPERRKKMDCETFVKNIFAYLFLDMDEVDAKEFEIHFFNCLTCRERLLRQKEANKDFKELWAS